MSNFIDITSPYIKPILNKLLEDKTTKGNILWATGSYSGHAPNQQMTAEQLKGIDPTLIQPRIKKVVAEQKERTKKHAEVFTPSWVCNKMNNICDDEWFERKNVFNYMMDKSWMINGCDVQFTEEKTWQMYVDSRRLEITCGEAPFLVSRYDTTTGELIPISDRIGVLDRKLRVVCENVESIEEWRKWATRAIESIYGYEYQGDNLLIARINILMTYVEYMQEKWQESPTTLELSVLANKIAWNIWQMDGLKGIPPFLSYEEDMQVSFFTEEELISEQESTMPKCIIHNWRSDRTFEYNSLKEGARKMKFDFVIGNPPYQEDTIGDNKTYAPPVYHRFLEEAYKISDAVEMIHPGRFLFDAGGTPKEWNEKMLNDEHLKIEFYTQNSDEIFPNTDIKGGVAISYHDTNKQYEKIELFSPFEELRSIKNKVWSVKAESFSKIVLHRGQYRFSKIAYKEFPEEMKKTSDPRIASSSFDRMPSLFTEEKPDDGYEYIQMFGRINNKQRVYRWFRKDLLKPIDHLYKYKVILPKANGSGALGEVLSTPLIGEPLIGYSETYIGIGSFDNFEETEACLKYVKSKFARCMLGIKKITQGNDAETWQYVPLQDFTANSDIDWSKSVAEIDEQLFAKYGLDEKEIDFIKTKVKEME